MKGDAAFNRLETADGLSLFVAPRVSSRNQHDGCGIAGVDLRLFLVEGSPAHCDEVPQQVGLNAGDDRLGLRVTHTHIIFDHIGVVADPDQSEKDESPVFKALTDQPSDGGHDDPVLDLMHEILVGKGHRRDGSHAAGVQAAVAFANAFIIFGRGQQHVRFSVGEHKTRYFYPAEIFLYHHPAACRSELPVEEHGAEFLFGFIEIIEDEHSLASRQAVGLQHIRGFEVFEIFQSLFQFFPVEGGMGGSGDAVAVHEALGKVFAAFQHGGIFHGSDHHHAGQ